MPDGQYTQFPIDYENISAAKVPYDNTDSGLEATNVQDAIDELKASQGEQYEAGDGIEIEDGTISAIPYTAGDGIEIEDRVISATAESVIGFLPVDTASGAVASFPDGADNVPVKSLVAEINPVQAGSGDPSPENIRPISGRDAATVWDDPVYGGTVNWNQLCDFDVSTPLTRTWDTDTSAYYSTLGYVRQPISFIAERVYFIAMNIERNIQNNDFVIVRFGDATSKLQITCLNGEANGLKMAVVKPTTVPQSNNAIFYNNYSGKRGFSAGDSITVKSATAIDLTDLFGTTIADYIYTLEQANTGAGVAYVRNLFPNEYYPYNAGTETCVSAVNGDPYRQVTITLPQTVYGGTLDVTRGKLTVTHGVLDLGSLTWTYNTSRNSFVSTGIRNLIGSGTAICSRYVESMDSRNNTMDPLNGVFTINKAPVITSGTYGAGDIVVKDSAYTDAATFATAVSGAQLVYELETSVEVDVTPTEIKTLYGNNNIWADSGDVEVEYRADIQKYIQKMIAAALNA